MPGHEGPKKKGHAGKAGGVGRALIRSKKARDRGNRLERVREEAAETVGAIATAAQSVTATTSLQDFLVRAQMANTDFTATRGNFELQNEFQDSSKVILDSEAMRSAERLHAKYASHLKIPRRPDWDASTTPAQLESLEHSAFLEWRRQLAEIEEIAGVVLTPFERNLELWRQLWRVIERSQVLVQILDARNPLLFRSLDLEAYATELEPPRPVLLLLNKADLLSPEQRQAWAAHFRAEGTPAVFWSAILEDEAAEEATLGEDGETTIEDEDESPPPPPPQPLTPPPALSWDGFQTSAELVSTDGLLSLLRSIGGSFIHGHSALTVGMIGYPNVGKSSTINRILGDKKVSVSATPGKTRHFQTLIVEPGLSLCDCPGLVMPSFSFSREEMLLNGILPVAQMRSFTEPISLLCSRIPAAVLEATYGITLPKSSLGAEGVRPLDLLSSLAFMRGYMSSKGVPDGSRAARVLVSDVVHGKLCWVAPPGGLDAVVFNPYPDAPAPVGLPKPSVLLAEMEKRHIIQTKTAEEQVDAAFFQAPPSAAVTLDPRNRNATGSKNHKNRKTKEKLRRLYGKYDVQ